VIRPGAIGDFIVSLPAIESLRTPYFEVWAGSQNVPLVRFADRVRSIASTGLDLLGITETDARLIESLRGFDSIVSWYGANRPDFRELVLSLGLPFHFFPALPSEHAGVHAVDFYADQTGLARGAWPHIPVPPRAREFAVLHPGSGSARKNWPLERFQELARRLASRMAVRWCAGPDSAPIEDLYELACWLAAARVYIGNDSGITHLAAAAGAPTIALFGPTDPRVWAPRGSGVQVIARTSLHTITVDDVLALIK
jgi:heptosyltransferase-3